MVAWEIVCLAKFLHSLSWCRFDGRHLFFCGFDEDADGPVVDGETIGLRSLSDQFIVVRIEAERLANQAFGFIRIAIRPWLLSPIPFFSYCHFVIVPS